MTALPAVAGCSAVHGGTGDPVDCDADPVRFDVEGLENVFVALPDGSSAPMTIDSQIGADLPEPQVAIASRTALSGVSSDSFGASFALTSPRRTFDVAAEPRGEGWVAVLD